MALNTKHFLGGTKFPMEDGGERMDATPSLDPAVQFLGLFGHFLPGEREALPVVYGLPQGHRAQGKRGRFSPPVLGLS